MPLAGAETATATVVITAKTLPVKNGHEGTAEVSVQADSRDWLLALPRERPMLKEILLRRLQAKGPLPLSKAFGRCFA